jgi:hypothetical protein
MQIEQCKGCKYLHKGYCSLADDTIDMVDECPIGDYELYNPSDIPVPPDGCDEYGSLE